MSGKIKCNIRLATQCNTLGKPTSISFSKSLLYFLILCRSVVRPLALALLIAFLPSRSSQSWISNYGLKFQGQLMVIMVRLVADYHLFFSRDRIINDKLKRYISYIILPYFVHKVLQFREMSYEEVRHTFLIHNSLCLLICLTKWLKCYNSRSYSARTKVTQKARNNSHNAEWQQWFWVRFRGFVGRKSSWDAIGPECKNKRMKVLYDAGIWHPYCPYFVTLQSSSLERYHCSTYSSTCSPCLWFFVGFYWFWWNRTILQNVFPFHSWQLFLLHHHCHYPERTFQKKTHFVTTLQWRGFS